MGPTPDPKSQRCGGEGVTVAAPFSSMLRGVQGWLEASSKSRSWWWPAVTVRVSKWSVSLCVLWMLRLAADVVLADSSEARRIPLRQFLGIYSCLWGAVFFLLRTRAAFEALAPMQVVAGELERWGAAETKGQLAAAARRLRRVALFYYFLGLTQVAGITKTVYDNRDSAVSSLIESNWRHGRVVTWLLYFAHTGALIFGIYAYYTMLAMLFSTYGSCSALFRAVGAESRCASRRGAAAVAFLAEQHSRLLDAARRARLLFADLFAHIVTALLTLPLLGTAEMLVNVKDVDSLDVATFAVMGTIFMPICLAGQELEDSSAAVRQCLYEGPWLLEDAPTRRARAQFMLGAGCSARMAFGGLGSLNAASCLLVVNRWFSLLNVYINTNKRHAAEPLPP